MGAISSGLRRRALEEEQGQPTMLTASGAQPAGEAPLWIGKNIFSDDLLDFHQQLAEIVSRGGFPTESRKIMKIAKLLIQSLVVMMMSGFPILRNI